MGFCICISELIAGGGLSRDMGPLVMFILIVDVSIPSSNSYRILCVPSWWIVRRACGRTSAARAGFPRMSFLGSCCLIGQR
jgi:hypothetical protein